MYVSECGIISFSYCSLPPTLQELWKWPKSFYRSSNKPLQIPLASNPSLNSPLHGAPSLPGVLPKKILAYSSTPYVGMTPKKMAATLKVYKWHARNVSVRLVNGLHEPYQVLSSASMGNRTVNFASEHHWSTRLASCQNGQIVYLLTVFLLSFLHHDRMITAEAITKIQITWKNGINHWVLHLLLIMIIAFESFFSDSQALWC